ncbi:MAG: TolC family protein [Vicinamibacterales bacterium]
MELGVGLTWPFQQRKADGQRAKACAALTRADSEIRWLEDQIRADVQDALSAVRAARGVLDAVAAETTLARELEQLERDRFALGDSTQFLVNLRELATADAAVREIRARADVQKARAALDAALGPWRRPPRPERPVRSAAVGLDPGEPPRARRREQRRWHGQFSPVVPVFATPARAARATVETRHAGSS